MLLPRHTGRTILAHAGLRRKLKEPSSAGQSAASERHRMKFRIGRPSYRPCVRTHTFMSSKTQYTNTRRNARVSALFCVSRQKLARGVKRYPTSGRGKTHPAPRPRRFAGMGTLRPWAGQVVSIGRRCPSCWEPSTSRVWLLGTLQNRYYPRWFRSHPGNVGLIDTFSWSEPS